MIKRLFLPILLMSIAASAAAADSIAYVDMQQVLEQSKIGQRVQEQLRKDFEPRGQELAKEEVAIRQLQQTLERDAPLMSKDQVESKEQEIQGRIETYQKEAAAAQQELLKEQQEKGREILMPAQEAVNAVAKDKKLGMVIERNLSGILYLDDALDITTAVIKQMDADTQ